MASPQAKKPEGFTGRAWTVKRVPEQGNVWRMHVLDLVDGRIVSDTPEGTANAKEIIGSQIEGLISAEMVGGRFV